MIPAKRIKCPTINPCPQNSKFKTQNSKLIPQNSPMPTATFEKTNIPWQIQQSGQRLSEWVELKLSELRPPKINAPDWQLPGFSIAPRVWEVLFWLVVIMFVSWVLLRLYPVGQRYWRTWQARGGAAIARVEPMVDRPVAAWLQQAQKFQQQGNYPEACRALYLAMLQQLNDAKIAPHELSRTDGEYLRLVTGQSDRRAYGTLLAAHEQLCFGDVALDSEDFQRCQRAYREIAGSAVATSGQK